MREPVITAPEFARVLYQAQARAELELHAVKRPSWDELSLSTRAVYAQAASEALSYVLGRIGATFNMRMHQLLQEMLWVRNPVGPLALEERAATNGQVDGRNQPG
jgi:hypothetical protein